MCHNIYASESFCTEHVAALRLPATWDPALFFPPNQYKQMINWDTHSSNLQDILSCGEGNTQDTQHTVSLGLCLCLCLCLTAGKGLEALEGFSLWQGGTGIGGTAQEPIHS